MFGRLPLSFRPCHPWDTYVFTSGPYRIDMGVFLFAMAMGLNIPLGVTVRPTHGNETGQTRLQLPPCALHEICMVRMWRMKHSLLFDGFGELWICLINLGKLTQLLRPTY